MKRVKFPRYLSGYRLIFIFERDEILVPAAVTAGFIVFNILADTPGLYAMSGAIVIFYIAFRTYRHIKSKSANGVLHHWKLERGLAKAVTKKDEETDPSLALLRRSGREVWPDGFVTEFQD